MQSCIKSVTQNQCNIVKQLISYRPTTWCSFRGPCFWDEAYKIEDVFDGLSQAQENLEMDTREKNLSDFQFSVSEPLQTPETKIEYNLYNFLRKPFKLYILWQRLELIINRKLHLFNMEFMLQMFIIKSRHIRS